MCSKLGKEDLVLPDADVAFPLGIRTRRVRPEKVGAQAVS